MACSKPVQGTARVCLVPKAVPLLSALQLSLPDSMLGHSLLAPLWLNEAESQGSLTSAVTGTAARPGGPCADQSLWKRVFELVQSRRYIGVVPQ